MSNQFAEITPDGKFAVINGVRYEVVPQSAFIEIYQLRRELTDTKAKLERFENKTAYKALAIMAGEVPALKEKLAMAIDYIKTTDRHRAEPFLASLEGGKEGK